jgi:hypothetical protein
MVKISSRNLTFLRKDSKELLYQPTNQTTIRKEMKTLLLLQTEKKK